jgi:hypothetical protein
MAVELTREDRTPAQVRLAAGKTKDARAARRMPAIALVLEGVDRKTAAETCGMDRQTLRDWVHRYDDEGLAGLTNRPSPGRRSRLPPRAEGRARGTGGGRSRSRTRRRGALAADRSQATHRGRVRRGDARAQRRQATPGACAAWCRGRSTRRRISMSRRGSKRLSRNRGRDDPGARQGQADRRCSSRSEARIGSSTQSSA